MTQGKPQEERWEGMSVDCLYCDESQVDLNGLVENANYGISQQELMARYSATGPDYHATVWASKSSRIGKGKVRVRAGNQRAGPAVDEL